jgi:hypothetical protein
MTLYENENMLPIVQVLPRGYGEQAWKELRCEFGWNAQTTQQFLTQEFRDLSLRAMPDQTMEIPVLGEKANSVKRLLLQGPGRILGIEQFKFVDFVFIDNFPHGGVDFDFFQNLRVVSMAWDRTYSKKVLDCTKLQELYINEGFTATDCEELIKLVELRCIAFSQGKIRCLNGLDRLPHLEEISVAYARNFSTLGDLSNYPKLNSLHLASLPKLEWDWQVNDIKLWRSITLENLPTIQGTLDLTGCREIREIRIVKCPDLTADISGLHDFPNLETLWLADSHKGLNVEDLFSRPKLRFFALTLVDQLAELDDVALRELAARHGRTIKSIDRVGPRKSRQLQVFFD